MERERLVGAIGREVGAGRAWDGGVCSIVDVDETHALDVSTMIFLQ